MTPTDIMIGVSLVAGLVSLGLSVAHALKPSVATPPPSLAGDLTKAVADGLAMVAAKTVNLPAVVADGEALAKDVAAMVAKPAPLPDGAVMLHHSTLTAMLSGAVVGSGGVAVSGRKASLADAGAQPGLTGGGSAVLSSGPPAPPVDAPTSKVQA